MTSDRECNDIYDFEHIVHHGLIGLLRMYITLVFYHIKIFNNSYSLYFMRNEKNEEKRRKAPQF